MFDRVINSPLLPIISFAKVLTICLLNFKNFINITQHIIFKRCSIMYGQIHVTLCSTYLLNSKNYYTCFLTICFYRLRLWSMLASSKKIKFLKEAMSRCFSVQNFTESPQGTNFVKTFMKNLV